MKRNTFVETTWIGLFLNLVLVVGVTGGAEPGHKIPEGRGARVLTATRAALQKEREEAENVAGGLTVSQREKLLELLNEGDIEALEPIEGISRKKARRIIASRPFVWIEDLLEVKGIGPFTFARVVKYGAQMAPK